MKHLRSITERPVPAQIDAASIFTAISQIFQVVGAMLVEKQAANLDPWDY